jgi:HSP20 family protein
MAKEVTRSSDQAPARRPVDLFDAMRADLDRVFERFERGWPSFGSFGLGSAQSAARGLSAQLDVREEDDKLVIEADLPGVEEKDVAVTLANGVLTIKGERKSEREEKKDDYHIAERSFGRFERSLRLPDAIDENRIEANFDKGVLKIVAQKRPEAVKAEKRIEIKKP